MNRRTFFKLTGITVITAISTPALSVNIKQKEQPQWISFDDKIPEIGQKVIITNMSRTKTIGGIISDSKCYNHLESCKKMNNNKYYVIIATTKLDFRQCFENLNKNTIINNFYSDKGEEILKSRTWLKSTAKIEDNDMKALYYCHTYDFYFKKKYMWIPVNGEYPINIPSFPKKNNT